jgi:hypothetical protein
MRPDEVFPWNTTDRIFFNISLDINVVIIISSEEIKSYNHMRLAGGASAGSPMAVTYADERPPSTGKSVPL